MKSTERNKKPNQIPSSNANITTDTKANFFNTPLNPNRPPKQTYQLLDKKKNNNNPYRLIDSFDTSNNLYHTTKQKALQKDSNDQQNNRSIKQTNTNTNKNINSNKQKESIEKYSTRTVYNTSSNSSKNIKKAFENSLDTSNKTNTKQKRSKKVNCRINELTNTSSNINSNDYATSSNFNQRLYANSFISKKNQNKKVNTSPSLHSINSKSNNNIKVNNNATKKQQHKPNVNKTKMLNNSKSNKTVKYYSLNSKSNQRLIVPKTTINMQFDDKDGDGNANANDNDNSNRLVNMSLEKENETNITSILYLLTKTNNFLSDSFKKFIDFFPLNSKDSDNVLNKKNDEITGNDLLSLANNNRKILNWNLAKSELFFDINMIHTNIKELKERINSYPSGSNYNANDNRELKDNRNEKESQLRIKQNNQYFELCYSSIKDINTMLNDQIKEIDYDSNKLNESDIVINNNVDDVNNDKKNKCFNKNNEFHHNEEILIEKLPNGNGNNTNSNAYQNKKPIANVNIIGSVTNSNINVNVNVNVNIRRGNLKNSSSKNANYKKKKSKRKNKTKTGHQQAKKLISKRKFKNEICEDDGDNGNVESNIDSDVSLGNDQGGIVNCPKTNLFNVQKPKEENLKYKVYTSKSGFESSEHDEKSVSKIVIGEIESYKDIIEQDKISAFRNMRSKSSFNLKPKKKKEKAFSDYRILEDERQISDLLDDDEEDNDNDDMSHHAEDNDEEINDEFNDEMGSQSKHHLHLLPYHISKISFCKIFDRAHGKVKLTEDYQNINLPMGNKKKSLIDQRTQSKTFYINDKQGLEPQKNKECVIV